MPLSQGLESLGGRIRPGLPFDMGSPAGNAFFTSFTLSTHDRLGTTATMPRELLGAGGDAVTAHPHFDSNTGRLLLFSYQVIEPWPSILSPNPK